MLVKEATITGDFKIFIDDIYLHACKVTVSDKITMAHNVMLMKQPSAHAFDKTRMLTFSANSGITLFREDKLFLFENQTG
jgi:hypothetical protein